MNEAKIDNTNGCPTEETLEAVRKWPADDSSGLFDYIKNVWTPGGILFECGGDVTLITCGWRGNEGILNAMQDNAAWWSKWWQSSHRGGRHEFRIAKHWLDGATINWG